MFKLNKNLKKWQKTIDIELEKSYGKILLRSFVQYCGGYRPKLEGGEVAPFNPGMIYLTENYFVFKADVFNDKNRWEIIIPIKSIITENWDPNSKSKLNDSKIGIKIINLLLGKGIVIPFVDENGILHEPVFQITRILAPVRAVGVSSYFGGGGLKKLVAELYNVIIRSHESESTKKDAFLCHDSRDKAFVDMLYSELTRRGARLWYDKFNIKIGHSITDKIEEGLQTSNFGIVIISKNFLENKGWSHTEFRSIKTREISIRRQLILPVWLNGVSKEDVEKYSLDLADRHARLEYEGMENIASEIFEVLKSAR